MIKCGKVQKFVLGLLRSIIMNYCYWKHLNCETQKFATITEKFKVHNIAQAADASFPCQVWFLKEILSNIGEWAMLVQNLTIITWLGELLSI